MRALVLSLCLMAMAGCSTVAVTSNPIERPLPAEAMQKPADLPLLLTKSQDEKSAWVATASSMYGECVSKVEELSTYILSNRK